MGWLGLGAAFARFDIDSLHFTFTHSYYHLLYYHINVLFHSSYHPRKLQTIILIGLASYN